MRPYLLIALAGAVGLYALSRTQRGQVIAGDVAETVMSVLPLGIRNNNPGNIRWIESPGSRWRGMVRQDANGFGVFDTAANGVRAIGKELLLDASRGIRTVRGLISNWAPSNENNTAAYVNSVKAALGVAADEPIDVAERLSELAAAIIKHENGIQPYTVAELRSWVNS